MTEELKNEVPVENPTPEETGLPEAQEPVALQVAVPTAVTMWNDAKMMNQSFGWSGSFCAAAINGSGRFTPLEFVFVGERDKPSWGCYATAVRASNGVRCYSDTVTIEMAMKEGWYSKKDKYGKETSKWQSMPMQMMMYRAAAFFARAHCSDLLLGMPTYEEVQDVKGYEEEGKQTVVTLDGKDGA